MMMVVRTGCLFVVACVIALGLGAPVENTRDVPDDSAWLEVSSSPTMGNSTEVVVTCPLCLSAMTSLLDFCRDFDGRSMSQFPNFVSKCSHIGEKELTKKDIDNGCPREMAALRSRARMWNRKLKCLKIYNALATAYTPFDPCTQIRNVVDKAPMSICNGPDVLCIPPPDPNEAEFSPPWANASLPYEYPPLTCPQYVYRLDQACKAGKENDFYFRSNLDGECSRQFNKTHQISGCETVRTRMFEQDKLMDLCSTLYAKPITAVFTEYCDKTLNLPATGPVPDSGYEAYLERGRLYREAWTVQTSTFPARSSPLFPVEAATDALNTTVTPDLTP